MNAPLSKNFLGALLACALFSPGMPAQASEPNEALSVTFDNPIQFLEPGGGQVFVPSGTYSVMAKPDQLILGSPEGTSISLEAAEATHSNAVPFPLVVSTSGLDADLAGFHLLVVLYPDGHTLQAVGTYPKVTSRGILKSSEENLEYFDPTLVTFKKSVYFIAPDGSPVVVQPGTYTAEAASPWIRLIPGQDRQQALLIEAQQGTQDTGIEDLLALSLPGGILQEVDLHEVMLLLPTGQSFEATGTYSGIQDRGFWKKRKSKKAKKRKNFLKSLRNNYKKIKKSRAFKQINQAAKQANKTAAQGSKAVGGELKKGWSSTKWAAGQAGKGVVQGANATWKGMKWVAGKAGVGACLAFFKGQEAVAKLSEGAMKVVMKEVEKVRKNSKLVNDVVQTVEDIQKKQQQLIDNAVKSSLKYMDPKLLNGLKDVVKFDNICKNGIGETQKKVKALFAQNQVRSRGIFGNTTSIGIQGAGTFKFGGLEGGMGRAWNPDANKTYWFAGGSAQLPQLSGSVLIQFGRWQSLGSLEGGYLAAGVTIPLYEWAKIAGWVPGEQGVPGYKGGGGPSVNITIDFLFSMDFTKKKPFTFVGLVVSPGVSAGLANTKLAAGPLGAVTIQSGYGGFIKDKP